MSGCEAPQQVPSAAAAAYEALLHCWSVCWRELSWRKRQRRTTAAVMHKWSTIGTVSSGSLVVWCCSLQVRVGEAVIACCWSAVVPEAGCSASRRAAVHDAYMRMTRAVVEQVAHELCSAWQLCICACLEILTSCGAGGTNNTNSVAATLPDSVKNHQISYQCYSAS
jgi:hypothetical protein